MNGGASRGLYQYQTVRPRPLSGRVLPRFSLGQSRARRTHMGHSQFDDASREPAAWNAGKEVGAKRPLSQKQIWAVSFFLDRERRIRDHALFDLAIDSKLRGCDLVKIRIRDLVAGPEIRTRAIDVQHEDGAAGPVRNHQRRESEPSGLARTTWRLDRGLCVPEPGRLLTPHEHQALRAVRRRMGDRDCSAL